MSRPSPAATDAQQVDRIAVAQLQIELPISETHLRQTIEMYWERGWRREHTGFGIHPDDHLWRAATGVTEIRDALSNLA